jgi:hypothetical protein
MSYLTKLMCGIILLTVPTIQFGGYFLLQILSGRQAGLGLNEFQKAMFRAGHAHAGVWVIFSLVAQVLVDHAALPKGLEWLVRIGFPLAAILVSAGFFGAASGKDVQQPTQLIVLVYAGALLLAAAVLTLGIGLLRNA